MTCPHRHCELDVDKVTADQHHNTVPNPACGIIATTHTHVYIYIKIRWDQLSSSYLISVFSHAVKTTKDLRTVRRAASLRTISPCVAAIPPL